MRGRQRRAPGWVDLVTLGPTRRMRWTRRALEELALLEQAGAEDEWSYLEGQQDRPSLLSREAASWSRLTIMLVLMAAAVWLIPIAFAFALEF